MLGAKGEGGGRFGGVGVINGAGGTLRRDKGRPQCRNVTMAAMNNARDIDNFHSFLQPARNRQGDDAAVAPRQVRSGSRRDDRSARGEGAKFSLSVGTRLSAANSAGDDSGDRRRQTCADGSAWDGPTNNYEPNLAKMKFWAGENTDIR